MNILTEFIVCHLNTKYEVSSSQYGDLLLVGDSLLLVSNSSVFISANMDMNRILSGIRQILNYPAMADLASGLLRKHGVKVIDVDLCNPALTEDKIEVAINRCVGEIGLLSKGYDMKLAALFEWLNVKRDTELCAQMMKLSASIVGITKQPSGDFVKGTLIEMGRLMKRVKIDEPDTDGKQAALVRRLNRRIQEVYNDPKQFLDFKSEFIDFIDNMGLKLSK